MKALQLLQLLFCIFISTESRAITVYSNTFDTSANLAGFTIVGGETVSVVGQELQATIASNFGRGTAMLDTSVSFTNPYNSVLASNPGLVTWAFNVSNSNGAFNNGFSVVLTSDQADPYLVSAHGYYFTGGGMVGDRMGLWRYDFGLGGGQTVLIDVTNGLGPLPQMGSIKVTYEPSSNLWSLYGLKGTAYSDPLAVSSLLGTWTDGTYTGQQSRYFGLGGVTSGMDRFDNLTVLVAPEPSMTVSMCLGLFATALSRRRKRQRS